MNARGTRRVRATIVVYLKSLDTPNPFPTDKVWQSGKLTGRFLTRNDPRGLFLGEPTNCCQHPKGAGASCAWWGQENAKSGFFVIENANKEVVAQSWVWIADNNAVVFDNCRQKASETVNSK